MRGNVIKKYVVIACTFANILAIAYLGEWVAYRVLVTMTPNGGMRTNRIWANVSVSVFLGSILVELVLLYCCYRVLWPRGKRPESGFPVMELDEESESRPWRYGFERTRRIGTVMSKPTRFYPCWCPRCGHEGEMFISKKETGALCFSCAECSWTCDRPDDLHSFQNGYEGFKMALSAPTIEEIKQWGWLMYCVYSE